MIIPRRAHKTLNTPQKSVAILKPDPQQIDPDFLYFAILSEIRRLIDAAGGTAQKNLLLRDIRAFSVRVPSRSIQERVVTILSPFDRLITVNENRIESLQSLARLLYRQATSDANVSGARQLFTSSIFWRFVSENVGRYGGTKRYYATADIDGLDVVGDGVDVSYEQKPSRAQKQPDKCTVWFARMKDTYKVAWYGPSDGTRAAGHVLSSGFAGFQAAEEEFFPLLLLTISSREFQAEKNRYCTGATQMSLTNEGLSRIAVPLPTEQEARWLGRSAAPVLAQISVLQTANRGLREVRRLVLERIFSKEVSPEVSLS